MRTISKRILTVDDIYEFIQREESLLSREDLNLVTVISGQEALFQAQNDKPDLMILNYYMPDLNGYQVCRQIKGDSSTKDIPVLILAAPADESNYPSNVTEAAGCDGCIEKPIQHDVIVPLIVELIGVPPRKHQRIPASLQCSITDEDGKRDATIVNLTPNGLCLGAEPAPWAGDIVKADMSLDGASLILQMAVRWSTETGGGGPGRAGVEFLDAPAELVEWLESNS
jgi:CheY-like chemotaxis protein